MTKRYRSALPCLVLGVLLCASIPPSMVIAEPISELTGEIILISLTGARSNINESELFGGYTLVPPLRSDTTYLIDYNGSIVHEWDTGLKPGNSAYLLDDGTLLRSGSAPPGLSPPFPVGGSSGHVQKVAWDGTVLWDFVYANDTHLLHHDVCAMPSGNVLMIAWEYKSAAEAIAAGRDPNLLDDGELMPDHIIEVEPTGPKSGKIVWEWHVWDHLVQDYDTLKPNYGVIKDHPELINLNFVTYPVASSDWNHINSVDYNEELDQVLLSVHQFNEIWIIDHSTNTSEAAAHTGGRSGRGGDLIYRWGNPRAYGSGVPANKKLYRQHNAQWIDDGLSGAGNILLFNNGPGRQAGQYSSVDELVPPIDAQGNYTFVAGSTYGPTGPIWSYTAPNPTDFYADRISSAQRLLNGNTLILDGVNGFLFEVTPDMKTVWTYQNPYPIGDQLEVFKVLRYYPPYIGNIRTLAPVEDVPYLIDLTPYIADPNTPVDELVLSENSSYAELSGFNLSVLYPNGVVHDVINLSVSDKMFTVHKDIFVEVTPVNDPPKITTVPEAEVNEDSEYNVEFNATDIDTPRSSLKWHVQTDATWLFMNKSTGVLNGTPNNGQVSRYGLTITVEDDYGASDLLAYNLTVINRPPVITTKDMTEATEDQLYYVDYSGDDEGLGNASWKFQSNASWLRFDNFSGVLNGTPENKDVGPYWVNISLDDGNGGIAMRQFTLTVSNVNDPPYISTTDVTSTLEDEQYLVRYDVSDIDTVDIVFLWSVATNASFLRLDLLPAPSLSGMPTNDYVGRYYVNVSVIDPHGATDSHNFTLEVINVNDPPTVTSTPMLDGVVDSEYNYQVEAMDVDVGDKLGFSLVKAPPGMVIDQFSGLITWTPGEGQSGTHQIIVNVSDSNASVAHSFIINVRPHLVLKILSPTEGQTVKGHIILKGSFRGSQNATLDYSIDNGTWTKIEASDITNWGQSVDLSHLSNGGHSVRVRAVSGQSSTEDQISFIVKNRRSTGSSELGYFLGGLALCISIAVTTGLFILRKRKPRKKN